MNEYLKKRNDELANEFFTLCNVMGNEKYLLDALKERLDRQHRTIIQSSMGVIKDLITHYAENHRCDPRNEDSLKWANEVNQIPSYFKYI